MITLTNSPIHLLPSASTKIRWKKSGAFCCLRIQDFGGGELSQTSSIGGQLKRKDVWQLSKEAQQNILYLNKQRLLVVDELKRMRREKQELLRIIEKSEKTNLVSIVADNESYRWELLFRIDSLVLAGMVSTADASYWRNLVVENKYGVCDSLMKVTVKTDAELIAELHRISTKIQRNSFHIIHICTEMEPLVSFGSLASYVTGLSRALQQKGNLVEVILPKYATLDLSEVEGLRETKSEFYSYFDGQTHGNRIWTGVIYGIGVTFIQPEHFSSFFNRESIYGYTDDFERSLASLQASLDYIVLSGKHPDILHIHNWETAIVGPLFWDIFVKQGLEGTRILLTCQEFESQRLELPDKLALCGLDPSSLNRPDRLQDNARINLLNILKGGIVYSNKIVMMSSMSSKEKIIRNLGHGLETTLDIHKDKVLSAPYGFEHSLWDPTTDRVLPENYDHDNMKGKSVCKAALQQRVGLSAHSSTVLVGCIFPEASARDLESLLEIVQVASKREGTQFIIMGESSDPGITRALCSFQDEMKGLRNENVGLIIQYDEALSHLIYGGSDIILCQSYEDSLRQIPLKAMRYGAAPINLSCRSRHLEDDDTRFSRFINSYFGNLTLLQALDEIDHNPIQWKNMVAEGMSMDFSWDAECYDVHISAYESIKNL